MCYNQFRNYSMRYERIRTMPENEYGPRTQRYNRRRKTALTLTFISAVLFALAIAFVIVFAIQNVPTTEPSDVVSTNTDSAITTDTEPEKDPPITAESTATISIVGDVLPHLSILTAAKDNETESHVFDPFFAYVSPYITKADYAVANLETTLGGTENGKSYTGYPRFNSPDSIATALKNAGFDMAMTANNHCYDTNLAGLKRTLTVLTENNLDTLGTVLDKTEEKYVVKEINGIKIGMISYTYETSDSYPDRPSINGIFTSEESVGHINSFDYKQLDKFYAEMETHLANMKKDGAEATILYIHWGNEYQLSASSSQKTIAQKMCDLGLDVIVGGHPHVIQPMDLLESTVDEDHKTVCIYSTGNFLSNQRRNLMDLKTGNTEDGIIFTVSFTKYSNGVVALEETDVIPTWINLHKVDGKNVYDILPLDQTVEDWKTAFKLTDTYLKNANESYERTMSLVGDGLTETKEYLSQAKTARLEEFERLNNQ